MASALWLGFSEPGRLAPFLALPVQVMVLPRLPQKAPLPGQRFFTPAAGAPMMAALCCILPPAEPSTFYIAGGEVRCSVVEEDYLPLIERLGRL